MIDRVDLCTMLRIPVTVKCPYCYNDIKTPFEDYDVSFKTELPDDKEMKCSVCKKVFLYDILIRTRQKT